jgi:wyosine [tRNA(Phe)-imidazoG37] synthetase (radical SAM superfamily)
MATFLFDQIVFGPVKSRRLGISLGINLLPVDSKICSFNCIYCECGRNPLPGTGKRELPTAEEVKTTLETRLSKMQIEGLLPDVITFAGNGEPTLHPLFEEIIDDTLTLRDKYAPGARVAVLSNATMLHRSSVYNALLKVDDNILKLDSGMEATIKRLNCPVESFSITNLVQNLKSFNGKLIIQTMFIRGVHKGEIIDNTTPAELSAWLNLIREIKPSRVMIYSIARDTPEEGLDKIRMEELRKIAAMVHETGIPVQVSG